MSKTRLNSRRLLSLLIIVAVAVSAIPGFMHASLASDTGHSMALAKVAEPLISYLNKVEQVEVVVLLREIPDHVLVQESLSWGREAVIDSLKRWSGQTQSSVIRVIREAGGVVLNKFWITNAIVARIPGRSIIDVASHPYVRRVIPNYRITIDKPVKGPKVDDARVESWGVQKIEAPKVWDMGYTGRGVRVCVLDTGVDVSHEALRGKMLTVDPDSPYYPGGWMEFDGAGNPILSAPHDTHGHGTHTSGTAVGGDTKDILIGVAPGATLMHGLVLPYGSGTFAQIIGGIEWAVDPYYIDPQTGERVYTHLPAHVISMSFGARNYFGDEFLEPIKHALLANVIPVAAAGNGGEGTIDNPGNIWGVFAVGATREDDTIASFSGGMLVSWPSPPEDWPFNDTYPKMYIKPDFSAPGVSIVSSVPGGGYQALSGTSMATPHVAGLIALILQATKWYRNPIPDLPEMVYKILAQTSLDLGDPGKDDRFGWGRVDAYDAVRKALQYAKISGVQGLVRDSLNGEPLSKVKVEAYYLNGTLAAYSITNSTGYFKIPLDPGTYRLSFSRFGYVEKELMVNVTVLNGTLTGVVRDSLTGNPVPGALIAVPELGLSTRSGSGGAYAMELPPGRYRVVVSASGYYNKSVEVEIEENVTTVLDLYLYPSNMPVVLSVRVTDELTGEPIEGANVTVAEAGASGVTGADGTINLTGFPPGTYRVSVYKEGYAMRKYVLELRPGTNELHANTTYLIGVMSYELDNYGKDIKEALMSYGYPSYAISLLEPMERPKYRLSAMIINYLGSDPGEGKWVSFIDDLVRNGTSIIFLDGWGYYYVFGGYLMQKYGSAFSDLGYFVPTSRVQDYRAGVMVEAVSTSHPIFTGVGYDEGSRFYVASSASDRADFAAYPSFSDPGFGEAHVLGRLVGEGTDYGAAVAVWDVPGNFTWVYLSVGGSYQWSKYMERGQDCMYSESVRRLLINSVLYSLGVDTGVVDASMSDAMREGQSGVAGGDSKPGGGGKGGPQGLAPDYYTEIVVELEREPFGWVEGYVFGADINAPIEGARVYIEGTPAEAHTDSDGYFEMWLPAGNHTLSVYAPGYYVREVGVEIREGVREDVNVTLIASPRAAIMFDHAGQLSRFLGSKGWYCRDFTDWEELKNSLLNYSYDVLILAGEYMGSSDYWPTKKEFLEVLNITYEKGLGIVFMSNYLEHRFIKEFPYGISLLYYYLRNPKTVGSDWDKGPVYYVVEKEHPIFEGYSPGDKIVIVDGGDYDFSWFDLWDGEVVARVGAEDSGVMGAGVGVKVTEHGTRWVLLSALAPEQWTDTDDWTEDAFKIFYNAVKWAAVHPLEVSSSATEVRVGDVVSLNISGVRGANLTVAFDNEVIYEGVIGPQGFLRLNLTIPEVPYGEHRVVAYSEGKYYGELSIRVLTSISITGTAAGGRMIAVNITGAPPSAPMELSIDDNYVTMFITTPSGTAHLNFSIPEYVPPGKHTLKVRGAGGEVYGAAEVSVGPSSFRSGIEASLSGLRSNLTALREELLERIEGSYTNISEQIAAANASAISSIEGLKISTAEEMSELMKNISITYSGLRELVISGFGNTSSKIKGLGEEVSSAHSELEDIMERLNDVRGAVSGYSGISTYFIAAAAASILTLAILAYALLAKRIR